MKTKLLIASILTIITVHACVSPLKMNDDGMGEVLIMNAQISTADTSHVVWLGYGTQDRVSAVLDGVVSCYVNGELIATTDQVDETVENTSNLFSGEVLASVAAYRFDARFSPGDHVSILALAGNHRCQASQDVLPAPIILNGHASRCETVSDQQFGTYRLELRLQDQKDVLNYHYLKLYLKSYMLVEVSINDEHYPWAPKVGDILDRKESETRVISTGEPLLNSGASTLGSQGSSQDSYFDNTTNLFTDLLFRDGEYTMHIYIDEKLPQTPSMILGGETYLAYHSAVVRLFNAPKEEYRYLTGYQFEKSVESSSYFTEDFVFPDNVEGGIGFVSINTAADYEIAFPTWRIDSNLNKEIVD
ncbi:MAG: DUF4249 domain-containing protein [Bacteroidales bacterium]|nr:DUF4249 domain-containing protein [Bacteroidales bacterium]